MMKPRLTSRSAFSMVELVIYIAIVSIITVSMMLFVIQMLEVRGEAEKDREVIENARFVMNKITREMRSAESLATGTGSFGTHPGGFRINTSGSTYLDIDTSTKQVTLGGSGYTVRYLQVNDTGAGPVQMTSDQVTVTNFVVNNLTRSTEPENLQIMLTLGPVAGTGASVDVQTSISLRE